MKLRIIHGGEERFHEVRDHESVIVIGRSTQCDVALEGNKRASRKHCQIEKQGESYTLVDLGSSNGTVCQGRKVTKQVALSLGDKIEIGDSIVFFGEPKPVKMVPPVQRRALESKPVERRADRRAEVRHAAMAASRMRSVAIFVGALFVLGVIGLVVYDEITSKPLETTAVAPKSHAERGAEIAKENDRKHALTKFDAIAMSGEDAWTRLAKLHAFVETQRVRPYAEELEAREGEFAQGLKQEARRAFEWARGTVRTYRQQHQYGAALEKLKAFRTSYFPPDGKPDIYDTASLNAEYDSVLKDLKDGARLYFFGTVVYLANDEVDHKNWGGAKKLYLDALDTNFLGFRSQRNACKEKVSLIDALTRAIELSRTGSAPASEAEIEKQVQRLKRSEVERSRDATKDNRPGQELRREPERPKAFVAGADEAELVRALHEHLVAACNGTNGESLKRGKILYSRKRRIIHGASATGLKVSFGTGSTEVEWAKFAPENMVGLYRDIKDKTVEDYWGIAIYCYNNELTELASIVLAELLAEDAELKPAIDNFMARNLGIGTPDGGFVLYKARRAEGRLITPAELDSIKRQAQIQELLKTIERKLDSNSTKARKEAGVAFEELKALGGDAIKPTVDAIKASKAKLMKKLEGMGFGNNSSLDMLKAKLEQARKRLMDTVFDKRCYPDEDHGQKPVSDWAPGPNGRDNKYDKDSPGGQEEVNRARAALEEIWNNPAAVVRNVNPAVGKVVDKIKALHKMLDDIDPSFSLHQPNANTGFLDWVKSLVNKSLNIKTYSKNGAERKRYADNAQIMKDNNEGKSEPSNARERAHVQILNDYRNMAGLTALRIDDRAMRAAQGHSDYMKSSGNFAHNTPGDPSGATPSDRMRKQGYPGSSENIAMSGRGHTPRSAFEAWAHSSGHHRNMLNPRWRSMGVGDAGSHWTQNFGSTPGIGPRAGR